MSNDMRVDSKNASAVPMSWNKQVRAHVTLFNVGASLGNSCCAITMPMSRDQFLSFGVLTKKGESRTPVEDPHGMVVGFGRQLVSDK